MQDTQTFTMQTPAAVLAPKQQYLNLMMNSVYMTGEVCGGGDVTPTMVKKLGYLTRNLISYIPNPKERERLLLFRKNETIEANKLKDLDARTEALFEIHETIIGEIMTLMDDVLSIVARQEVISTENNVVDDGLADFYPNGMPEPVYEELED